jgi:putative ABC transport system substrate-binding protein
MTLDLSGKRIALLKEIIPKLARLALVLDPRDPSSKPSSRANQRAAKEVGCMTQVFEVSAADEIEPTFLAIAREGFDGAFVLGAPLYNERVQVGASATAHKVPTIAGNAEQVPYGLLLSYGPDFQDYFRRAAGYVDRILKGAKPGDLPVDQPTRLKFVLNLKIAKVLGLTVPPSLLVSADEVIE